MDLESCPAVLLGPVFKVLAEPNRLRILCALGTECRPVTDIIHATQSCNDCRIANNSGSGRQ